MKVLLLVSALLLINITSSFTQSFDRTDLHKLTQLDAQSRQIKLLKKGFVSTSIDGQNILNNEAFTRTTVEGFEQITFQDDEKFNQINYVFISSSHYIKLFEQVKNDRAWKFFQSIDDGYKTMHYYIKENPKRLIGFSAGSINQQGTYQITYGVFE